MKIWTRIFTIITVVALSGCSVFKSSLRESKSDLERVRQNNIITESFQSGKIEIPARLFAAMARKDINFSSPDTTESAPSTDAPDASEPVTITFRNETTTTDNSTVVTDSSSSEVIKEEVERESGGLFGFWGGAILVGFVIVIGGAWAIIKFYF